LSAVVSSDLLVKLEDAAYERTAGDADEAYAISGERCNAEKPTPPRGQPASNTLI
jgi:hypothetical protein